MVDPKNSAAKIFRNLFASAVQPVEVGLFMPAHEDSSNRVARELEKLLRETQAINLRLFLTAQRPDPRVDNSPELRTKRFVHSSLLGDVVFPFQREKGLEALPDGILLAPDLLAEKYKGRVFVESVTDFNDRRFIEDRIIGNQALKMAFSVRNLQKFGKPIIDAFNQNKGEATLINSHPAILPGIRGLEGPFWTRFLDYPEYTTTLHVIEEKFDAGPVLAYHARTVNGDDNRPVMQFIRDAAPDVAEMIYDQVHLRLIRKGHHGGLKLQEGDVGYRTLPTQEEIRQAKERGIIFTDPHEQIAWLTKNYSRGRQSRELSARLNSAYREFRKTLDIELNPNSSFFLDRAIARSLQLNNKPAVLIPSAGKDQPDLVRQREAFENAGFEVFILDVDKLGSLVELTNIQELKHAFERPGALPLDPDLATYIKLLSLIDRDIVVSYQNIPKEMEEGARGIMNRLIYKIEAAHDERRSALDPSVKPVFVRLPEDSHAINTLEAIQALVRSAQSILLQAKAEVTAAKKLVFEDVPDNLKQALG